MANFRSVPACFALIFHDAFAAHYYGGKAAFGGALAGLIVFGARRAIFSNEAGLGTSPMAFGAAKTSQPVHEGLVAMLGPVIDTLFVCTLTALAILVTGVWKSSVDSGVILAAGAFDHTYPGFGRYLLLACIVFFSLSALFSSSYYGTKCFSFVFGPRFKKAYVALYTLSIVGSAISPIKAVLSFIDLMIVFMAVPTMLSSLLLSRRVVEETARYFSNLPRRNEALDL
jgi:AGCS family alanine or glycine:cation symporter